MISLLPLVSGLRTFHRDNVHCGSRGHKIKLAVDGGCLDSACPVMSVRSSRMWGLQGARSLGLRSGSCEVSDLSKPSGGGGAGEGRGGTDRMREGSREAASGSCPFGSDKRLHLAPYLSAGKTWLGRRIEDTRLQRLFFSFSAFKKDERLHPQKLC